MMIPEIVKWLLLLWGLILLEWLWQFLAEKAKNEGQRVFDGTGGGANQPGEGHGSSTEAGSPQDDEATRESELSRKSQKVSRVLQRNPDLADDLARLSGNESLPADKILENPDLVRRIAAKIDDRALDILEVASRQAAVELDLESGNKLKEVSTGGVYTETGPINDLADVTHLIPIEYANPSDLFDYRVATGQAQERHKFDFIQEKKLLYVLEDGSGSTVENQMADGNPRYIWSRGQVYKLARQALAGQSRFIYRQFDSQPHPLIRVTNPAEAKDFLDYATGISPSGGGTNIYNAFETAVNDINEGEGDVAKAEILIISDGEDPSMNDTARIQQMLGSKIRLHVIMIGGENEALKQEATTYKVYR
jgi:uncharacterized protein with von Willebrand factor type A (vWA) domain